MVRLNVKGDLGLPTEEELTKTFDAVYKGAWMHARQHFVREVMRSVPVATGRTYKAFLPLASKLGVSPPGPNPSTYTEWIGWNFMPLTSAEERFDFGNQTTWGVTLPETFDYNEYAGTKYVKHWMPAPQPLWENRGGSPTPWEFLLPLKADMISIIKKQVQVKGNAKIRSLFKISGRRRR